VIVLLHVPFNRRRPLRRRVTAALTPSLLRYVAASQTSGKDFSVKFQFVLAAAVAASLVSPLAAQAQGIPDGVAHGAYVGNNAAGPLGAVVGGAVGGVIGGINGVLGIGPSYAAYPAEEPRVYRHRVRHSYRHVHHAHTTS
jgi:hypothetical protein